MPKRGMERQRNWWRAQAIRRGAQPYGGAGSRPRRDELRHGPKLYDRSWGVLVILTRYRALSGVLGRADIG